MNPIAFIVAIVAAVVFGMEALHTGAPRRDWVAAGLCVLTVAWILAATIVGMDPITIGDD